MMKLRPPVKRHGGKYYLARQIVDLMPPHGAYLEPFVGGGSVLLNKRRAEREVAVDTNPGLILVWQVLAECGSDLIHRLRGLTYGRWAWDWAGEVLSQGKSTPSSPHLERIERAAAVVVRHRMSRGGLGKTFGESTRQRGGQNEYANSWATFLAQLTAICQRVRGVRFEHADGVAACGSDHTADTLIYADPPYLRATRTARDAYGEDEMTDEQHERLLQAITRTRARVMISHYRCDLYDAALADWRRVEWDMPNHSGQGRSKQRRVECLWMNF